MTHSELLKEVWNHIYDSKSDVSVVIENFFHPDYEQCINGVVMNRSEYIQHVLAQRETMTVDTIDYKHVLEKGDELFALYYPRGKNKLNLPLEAEVIAYYLFKNKKILKIHGQVRLIKGSFSDVDMNN